MALHTQRGAITVDAFQWLGGTGVTAIAAANPPIWAKQIALHTPGDGTLHVPTGGTGGTLRANPTDWVVQTSTGYIDIIPASAFAALYT